MIKALPKHRSQCSRCGVSRNLFCYSPGCLALVIPRDLVPGLVLPMDLSIVQHKDESLSKSTGMFVKYLVPDQCDVHLDNGVDQVPPFGSDTLLLFPSVDAVTLEEIGKEELQSYKRVVLVEGTWVKQNAALKRANVGHARHVKLKLYETKNWRRQSYTRDHVKHCLSSIEAVYYFYKEYIEVTEGRYDGRMDGLLFFWLFTFEKYKLHQADRAKKVQFISD